VKSWASNLGGGSLRDTIPRAALAVVLLGVLVWFLPGRRPGEEGGHHGGHAPALDLFETAGVSELKEGQEVIVGLAGSVGGGAKKPKSERRLRL